MRNKDVLLIENIYMNNVFLREYQENATLKMIMHFKKTSEQPDAIIRDYISKFEKIKDKLPKKDPFQYKTFQEFENVIDSNTKNTVSKADIENVNVDNLKVYEDKNIIVYKARNATESIKLGNNQYYSFCISRKSGNLYSGYRLRAESTFYFVRFKNKSDEKNGDNMFVDPSHYIVIDAQSSGRYQWTWADNGSQGHPTKDVTVNEIVKDFPELKTPFNNEIFENDPSTKEEKQKLKKFQNLNNDFNVEVFKSLNPNEKEEYIKSGFKVSSLSILDKVLRNEYLGMGHMLSNDDFKSLNANEKNRWLKFSIQVCYISDIAELYVLSNEPVPEVVLDVIIKDSSTSHYYAVILLHSNKPVPENIVNRFASNGNYYSHYARLLVEKGKPVPEVILNSIVNDLVASVSYATILIRNDIPVPKIVVNSIAKDSEHSYEYAKFLIKNDKPVPEIIVNRIVSDNNGECQYSNYEYSYQYALLIIQKNKPVPEIIMNCIAEDGESSYEYAIFLILKDKPVPEIILNSIAKDSIRSRKYAEFLIQNKKPVPEIIKAASIKP